LNIAKYHLGPLYAIITRRGRFGKVKTGTLPQPSRAPSTPIAEAKTRLAA
jgi:hypothetical protein